MYCLINQNVRHILELIERENHATDYCFLLNNLPRFAADDLFGGDYQRRYKRFWVMRFPSAEYRTRHFECLTNAFNAGAPPALQQLVDNLPENQFSFGTKLIHMVNRHRPIMDSKVQQFFLRNGALDCEFYDFLIEEYARIDRDHLLDHAVTEFRQQFPQQQAQFTNEKIYDSLIWAFVKVASDGNIAYF